jgi:gluconokinase
MNEHDASGDRQSRDGESASPALAMIVTGVSGCGKTSVGTELASLIGARFIEGDEFHSSASLKKMSHVIALNDADRWPWLDILGGEMLNSLAANHSAVASCSALTRRYRNRLRDWVGEQLRLVYLQASNDVLKGRLETRAGHFMPSNLLENQLN